MPRVPVHDLDTAPQASRQALENQAKRVGKVINIFGEMAHSPALMELYDTVESTLAARSTLGEPTRQAIHLAVAAVNDCEYCQAAYTGASKAQGFSTEETVQIRQGSVDGNPELSAALAVAREIADRRGYVDDATWQAALDAGWNEAQLLEVYAEVVRTILTNYFNHLVGTELDLPAAPEIPG